MLILLTRCVGICKCVATRCCSRDNVFITFAIKIFFVMCHQALLSRRNDRIHLLYHRNPANFALLMCASVCVWMCVCVFPRFRKKKESPFINPVVIDFPVDSAFLTCRGDRGSFLNLISIFVLVEKKIVLLSSAF